MFQVFEGTEVAVVEAMKMQNMLRAEKTGKVCTKFYFYVFLISFYLFQSQTGLPAPDVSMVKYSV